jgi:hypothetical protein
LSKLGGAGADDARPRRRRPLTIRQREALAPGRRRRSESRTAGARRMLCIVRKSVADNSLE